MMKKNSDHLISIMLIPVFLIFQGCVGTGLLLMSPVSDSQTKTTVIMEDSILAVGIPDIKEQQNKERDLVFVGLKHSYVVKSGADMLKEIVSSLDGNYIEINNGKTIEFEVDENGFHGSLDITYLKNSEKYSDEEKKVITNLAFCPCSEMRSNYSHQRGQQTYSKHIVIKGIIYPKAKNLNDIQSKFKKSRSVRFIAKHTETTVDSKKIAYKIFMLPVAVAFDVITFPFLIIGGTVMR